jgi:hypothetical protein
MNLPTFQHFNQISIFFSSFHIGRINSIQEADVCLPKRHFKKQTNEKNSKHRFLIRQQKFIDVYENKDQIVNKHGNLAKKL